jgi:glycosyltransferase involved in cell wall biosynthesis
MLFPGVGLVMCRPGARPCFSWLYEAAGAPKTAPLAGRTLPLLVEITRWLASWHRATVSVEPLGEARLTALLLRPLATLDGLLGLGQVDPTVVFTERDRRALAPLAAAGSIFTVPLGTDIPTRPLDPMGAEPPSVVFVGNFTHPPNVESATSLLPEIVPLVRRAVPGLQAFVVGPRPPAGLRRMEDAGTFVTGAVVAVDPYLERASVVVAPVWSGGGMRVKVLEALAAGKALVATPLALEGLEVVAGE